MIHRHLLALSVIAAGAAFLAIFFFASDRNIQAVQDAFAENSQPIPLAQRIELWRQAIKEVGAETAYHQLLTLSVNLSGEQQHALGHYFGRALYEERGLSGFSVCGDSLSGGCVHEFAAAAIQAYGTDILSQLNTGCLDTSKNPNSTTCQHGLGHGLMNYLGYTPENLSKALDACVALNAQDPVLGCYGGALMEFNLHTVANSTPRPFSAARPYAPCDQISATYAPACFFWLPQWIRNVKNLTQGTTETFTTIGTYCTEAKKEDDVYACFRGLGYEAPPAAAFDYKKTKTLCDAVSQQQKYRDACWSMASQMSPAPAGE